ncbi:MAG: 4-aminobutyrate aminotransferase [Bradymonadia bacterium]|jgi:4-aminobutyrate aminotransferase
MNSHIHPQILTPLPGPIGQGIVDSDHAHTSTSYIKVYPLVVERGEGAWITDVDGNRFLDFMAGIATASTGHSHPKVVQAIKDQADKFLHICGTDFYYDSMAKLAERLTNLIPGMGSKRVFLSNSGSECVDGALKLVREHTRRPYVIAFKGAFHGRSLAAISMNSSKVKYRKNFGPLLGGIFHVSYPPSAPHMTEHNNWERSIDEIHDIFKRFASPEEIGGIFIEPILGEGGYIIPPPEFLAELRSICDQHGIMLVFDEVQSGAGRTGSMYAADHFDIAPDVLLSAKGLASGMPLGAIIAREDKMTWPRASHGSTYGGNPVCCAAALATLDIIEPMLPQITATGEYLMKGLRKLAESHPSLADVRGIGLMIGAEFLKPGTKEPASALVEELEQLAFQKGLLLLSCGDSTIRFAPPLVIREHECDVALGILDECLTELEAKHF